MYDGRKGSSSPFEQTVYLLSAAGRAADALLADRWQARSMGQTHLAVLSALARQGAHARPDLAARLRLPAPEVSRALDELLEAALVQSMVVQVNGRHEVVTLTAAGEAALEGLHGDAAAVQEELLAPLTKGQRTELNALLRRVCAKAARAAAGSQPAPDRAAG